MLTESFRDLISAFNAEKVEYLVVGAYLLAAHGIPRATGDIDLWVKRHKPNGARVMSALRQFGAPLDNLSAEDFLTPDNVIQIGYPPERIDILTEIESVDFDEAYDEKLDVAVDGVALPCLSLRHLIINKKAVGRPQDLADIEQLRKLGSPSGKTD